VLLYHGLRAVKFEPVVFAHSPQWRKDAKERKELWQMHGALTFQQLLCFALQIPKDLTPKPHGTLSGPRRLCASAVKIEKRALSTFTTIQSSAATKLGYYIALYF